MTDNWARQSIIVSMHVVSYLRVFPLALGINLIYRIIKFKIISSLYMISVDPLESLREFSTLRQATCCMLLQHSSTSSTTKTKIYTGARLMLVGSQDIHTSAMDHWQMEPRASWYSDFIN